MFPPSLEPLYERYLAGLPAGVYLLEARIQEEDLKPERLLFASPRLASFAGEESPETLQTVLWNPLRIHPEDRRGFEESIRRLMKENEVWRVFRFERGDGRYLWIKEGLSVLEKSGSRLLLLGLWVDLTEEKEAFAEPQTDHLLWLSIFGKAPVGLILYDLEDGRFLYANPYTLKVLGYAWEELRIKRVWEVVPLRFRQEIKENLSWRAKAGRSCSFFYELPLVTKTGEERMVSLLTETFQWKDRRVGVGIGVDATPQLFLERRLAEVAFFDPLTGLPSRDLFLEKLRALILRGARKREHLLVAVLDLTNFREINATLGYEAGNRILKEVAARLCGGLRKSDIKSHFFADKFGLIFTDIRGTYSLQVVFQKVQELLKKPFRINSHEVVLSARIGGALFPRDGETPEELLSKAEAALKRAKESGEDVALYSPEIERSLAEEAFLRSAMVEGLARGEFFPVYQPIVRLSDRRIVGAEALIRWHHPELGLLPPARFIGLAEKTGFISELGDFILRKALEEMSPLVSQNGLFLCLNFSGRQFRETSLPQKIERVLKETDFPPEKFHLEITETTAMEKAERTLAILERLRSLGIKIVLDDFGMGYSSMKYLVEFEVDKIKIDRFFVSNLLSGEKPRHVVRTIVGLARSVGARCLAEGIEREEELEILKEIGCEEGQGFLFAPPLTFEKFRELVKG